jgi:hypothetical protein
MDYSSVGIIFMFILLIVVALVVAIKLLSTGEDEITTRQINSTPVPMDEGKFLTAFLKPVYDDGLEEMETAVESIRDGLDFYGRGAFVDAGEEFIDARRSAEAASGKFREVQTLVEDPAVDYAKKARNRLIDCRRLQDLAKDMESASDAMLDNRASDAKALEERVADTRKFAEEWKKE